MPGSPRPSRTVPIPRISVRAASVNSPFRSSMTRQAHEVGCRIDQAYEHTRIQLPSEHSDAAACVHHYLQW